MSDATYCDRCGDLFAGPPHMQVITANAELDLGPDCASALSDWFGEDEQEAEQARPTSTVPTDGGQ